MHSKNKTPRRVAVVGAGVVSPLGLGLGETLETLREARDCVTPVTSFSVEKTRCKTAAQIGDARLLPARNRRDTRLHRASFMVIAALDEALQQARNFLPEIAIVGTTSGGMTFGESFFRSLGKENQCAAARIANYPPQKQIVDALEKFGLDAPAQVIANACASGTNAIGHAFAAIQAGRYSKILAGGYDAISELVFVGFDSLQASTPEKCRPFDAQRSGMVLGEGAALFALEDLESAKNRGAEILGEIVGYGISTDNHHLTQPNPDGSGAKSAMQQALGDIPPERVGYINAHGTATIFNDAAEGKAIAEIFGNKVPVSSTKSMMGHSLGAAGAIEAAFTLLALRHQFLPPNINFRALDPALPIQIVANEARAATLDYALSNSFGFGGTNASILLRKAGP